MKRKLVVLANDRPGLETVKYLIKRKENIERIYLHSPKFRRLGDEIIKASKLPKEKIFLDKDLKDPEHVKGLQELAPDYIISIYWKWLLSPEVLKAAKINNLNFHPGMLPVGRGWYPHVYSFMNGTPTGVTIHVMDSGMDTGPIWAQEEIQVDPYDTCDTIYYKLQDKFISLFQKIWPDIISGKIAPYPQDHSKATVFTLDQINTLDLLELDKPTTGRKVINQLRARTFGKKGFCYYMENGQKVYVAIKLSPTPDFN